MHGEEICIASHIYTVQLNVLSVQLILRTWTLPYLVSSLLVDLGLVQVVDPVGAIEEAAAGEVGTAERLSTLDDVGIAGQRALGYTAEGTAA